MSLVYRSRQAALMSLLGVVMAAPASAQVAVTTQHNDLNRTGVNPNETILTTANVNVNTFGKLFTRDVDGQIYAQPLYVPGVQIPAQGMHNVIYVATEHNSVYAFDADLPSAWTPLWKVNLGPSAPAPADQDLVPEVGITSTPVIDLATNTIYVVAETLETGTIVFRIHALDITTGAEQFGDPTLIQGSVPATSPDSVNGMLAFNAAMQWQRTGLLLLNGKVYVGFGSHQDTEPYHGWIFAYDATTLRQTAILCLSPDGDSAGVWQAGVGLTADAAGNIYFQTGHGDLVGADHGDSVVKVSTANGLSVVDDFTPSNQAQLSANDVDFGSQGSLLIPGTSLLVAGGKDGKLFLLDTNNLGQFHATDQVVQEWQATFSLLTTGAGGLFAGNVFYNSTLYAWGRNDVLKAFAFNGSTFNTTPSAGTITLPDGYSNEPAMSLSAKGTMPATGILWAAYSSTGPADGGPYPGILRAFDASDVTRELWNSDQNGLRDYSGSWAKWSAPTIVNGKVYLASFDNVLNVFGLIDPGSLALTLTNFSATPSLPLQTGDEVTWRATAVGGVGPLQYQFWLLEPGTGWRVLQEWSAQNVTTWTPATPGSYIVQVWVRSAGSSLPYETWAGMGPFSVANGPLVVNAVSANRELPIVPGATATWRATTSGGDGTPLEFQFFRYSYQSRAWTIVQAYSACPEWTWTPTSSEVGGYHLQVWVRRQGSTAPLEAWKNSSLFNVDTFPLTVTLTSNQGDPPSVPPGTPITWHARTLGATTPLEYVFWRYDAQSQAWNVVQPYSAADTYSWTPSSSDVGLTVLQVWVRPVGSSDPFLAWAGTGWFAIFP